MHLPTYFFLFQIERAPKFSSEGRETGVTAVTAEQEGQRGHQPLGKPDKGRFAFRPGQPELKKCVFVWLPFLRR